MSTSFNAAAGARGEPGSDVIVRIRVHKASLPEALTNFGFLMYEVNDIRVTGKIGRAAEGAGVSYRHAWNLVEQWSDFFGVPLVERTRGSGTNLSEHAAVVAYVGGDMADVSFGVEAGARQFDLDFVRLVTEDYFFVCRKQLLTLKQMKRILTVMRGDEFQNAISELPGYRSKDTGVVQTVEQAFRRST